MCGRVTISASAAERLTQYWLQRYFGENLSGIVAARYNLAPTQQIPVLRPAADGSREFLCMRWGIPAPWNPTIINVRSETAMSKRTFKDSFMARRCLIPVDGFYEWQRNGKQRDAFHFAFKDRGIFALGAIWQPPAHGVTENTTAIMTVEANEIVRPLHDRMPLIIAPENHDAWLNASLPADDVNKLLRPYPANQMLSTAVGPAVNSVKNEGAQCWDPPLPAARTLFD